MRHLSVVRPAHVTALVLVAVLSLTGTRARADSYGELGHFGTIGTGHGQFRLTGPTINGTDGTRAFGVDATENAVYVGDEPKAKEYRIQKLTSTGAFVAATAGFKPPNRQGIEGIAFDPALERLYVLALERRSELLANDPHEPAAGTLYAFSTESTGESLPPASGTAEGVLTDPATFKSQSDVIGDALLKPRGIAVDPITHEVILMGELDEGGESPSIALQRVDAFTGSLGPRYVDHSGVLTVASGPNSPVVSPDGAVYVQHLTVDGVAQIVRIPSDFTSTDQPVPFISFALKGLLESEAFPVVEFATGGAESLRDGGGLSLSPGPAGESTIYAGARVFKSDGAGGGTDYPGVLIFKDIGDSEGFELGWTGGQSRQTTESCAIGSGGVVPPMVAGGAAETVFVLDAKLSRVDELGPRGSGCPTAEAGEIVATTNGTPASGPIAGGTEVTLTTTLTRANALSVEWDFDEGESKPQLVSADEYQNTRVTHKFETGGDRTVTETIHTDNLATPTILRTIEISVRIDHIPPTAVISGPLATSVGQAATFDGGASWDPNGAPGSSPIVSYRWDFGDGSSMTSETPEVEHTYAQTGLYVAKLVVLDGYGLESEASKIDVFVEVPAPTPPPSGPSVIPTGPPPPVSLVEPPPVPGLGGLSLASPVPDVRLTGGSLRVAPNGTTAALVTCPSEESGCEGTVTLQTLGAVSAETSRGRRSKKAVLTLARGGFAIAGGRRQSLSLRLSAAGRKLLARTGKLNARAIVVAHDAAGAAHTWQTAVMLRSGTAPKGRIRNVPKKHR